jgi:hypothetical protein
VRSVVFSISWAKLVKASASASSSSGFGQSVCIPLIWTEQRAYSLYPTDASETCCRIGQSLRKSPHPKAVGSAYQLLLDDTARLSNPSEISSVLNLMDRAEGILSLPN